MRKACLKMFALLLPLLLFAAWSGQEAAAAGSGKIVLDNRELALPKGIVLENVNGSVMIPIRVVTENLGYEVLWEQKTRKVTIRQDFKEIELFVGEQTGRCGRRCAQPECCTETKRRDGAGSNPFCRGTVRAWSRLGQ